MTRPGAPGESTQKIGPSVKANPADSAGEVSQAGASPPRHRSCVDDDDVTPAQFDHSVVLRLAEHTVDRLSSRSGHRRQIVLGERDGMGGVTGVDLRQTCQAAHHPSLGRQGQGVESACVVAVSRALSILTR